MADFFSKVRICAQKCAVRPCRRGQSLASNQAKPRPPAPTGGAKPPTSAAIRPENGRKWPKTADFFTKVRISAQKCALRPCRRGQSLASNQANPGPPRRPAAPHRPHPPQSGQKTAEYGQKWPISSQKCAKMRTPPMQARSKPRKQSGKPRPPAPTGGTTPPTSAAIRPENGRIRPKVAESGRFLLKSAHKCAKMRTPPMQARSRPRKQSGKPRSPKPTGVSATAGPRQRGPMRPEEERCQKPGWEVSRSCCR